MSELVKRLKSQPNVTEDVAEETKDVDYKAIPSYNRNRISLRVLSRIVIITSLLIVVYFASNDSKIKTFAKQSEMLVGKGQMLQCSTSYMNALVEHGRCFIKECKRYVSDKIITTEETEGLLKILQKVIDEMSIEGDVVLDLHTGDLIREDRIINIFYKPNIMQLFTEDDYKLYASVKQKVKHAVAHHFGVNPDLIYPTNPGYFSALTGKQLITIRDKYWLPHTDYMYYKSNHFSAKVYLNDYNIDFRGGRFMFTDNVFNRTVEPRKGRVLMYTSGPENRNFIEQVTSGVRYAVNMPFTCNRDYAVEDPGSLT